MIACLAGTQLKWPAQLFGLSYSHVASHCATYAGYTECTSVMVRYSMTAVHAATVYRDVCKFGYAHIFTCSCMEYAF